MKLPGLTIEVHRNQLVGSDDYDTRLIVQGGPGTPAFTVVLDVDKATGRIDKDSLADALQVVAVELRAGHLRV